MTVLHPAHKTTYFRLAGWQPDWIETAEQIVRDEFDRAYAELDSDLEDGPSTAVRTTFWFTSIQLQKS